MKSGQDQLFEGPVLSWSDIEQVELALRALVLHERTYLLKPALMVIREQDAWDQVRGSHREIDGRVVYPKPTLPDWLQSYLHSQNVGVLAVHDTWLQELPSKGFSGNPFWVAREATLRDEGRLGEAFDQYIAETQYGYSLSITPAALGLANYIADPTILNKEADSLRNGRAVIPEKVLSRLDEAWRKELQTDGSVGIRLAVGPFLLILLSRAASRSDLMEQLKVLRSEFGGPRATLWNEFNGVLTEHKLRFANAKTRKLEAAVQSIVPAAFPKESYPLKFGWDAARLAVELFMTGNFLPAAKYVVETAFQLNEHKRQVSRVEAARILASELHESDAMIVALRKHLTHGELRNLGIF